MKIVFVTPWYGPKIPGGMEAETRRTAANLQAAGLDVQVLTTCIKDFFSSWDKNYHPPGESREEGISVRRFPVEKTDRMGFRWASWRLQHNQRLTAEEEQVYWRDMIRCPQLLDHIAGQDQQTIFFFIPYLFSTTLLGAKIWPNRSAIIPCLHDESYAYLDCVRDTLSQVRALILHSNAEKKLVKDIYGAHTTQLRPVIGEGVDVNFTADGERFRKKYGINEPFMLAAGRRDQGKNTPLLLHYWRRYFKECQPTAKLILIGPGQIPVDYGLSQHIIDLGYIDMQDKYDAYAAATVVCQPSVQESFSLVIMESWLAQTAVLVHGHCAVTSEHCHRSNGGLYFTTYPEFAETTNYLFANAAQRRRMGANGRHYVLENYQWPTIVEKYKKLIGKIRDGR